MRNYPLVGMNRRSANCANQCMLGGWTDIRVIFGFKDCQAQIGFVYKSVCQQKLEDLIKIRLDHL